MMSRLWYLPSADIPPHLQASFIGIELPMLDYMAFLFVDAYEAKSSLSVTFPENWLRSYPNQKHFCPCWSVDELSSRIRNSLNFSFLFENKRIESICGIIVTVVSEPASPISFWVWKSEFYRCHLAWFRAVSSSFCNRVGNICWTHSFLISRFWRAALNGSCSKMWALTSLFYPLRFSKNGHSSVARRHHLFQHPVAEALVKYRSGIFCHGRCRWFIKMPMRHIICLSQTTSAPFDLPVRRMAGSSRTPHMQVMVLIAFNS